MKAYEASVGAKEVNDLSLQTYTLYRENDGVQGYSVFSQLNQWISLPAYFSVDMANSHNSIYMGQNSLLLEDLATDMKLSTTGGASLLKIQPSSGNSIGYAIENAMNRIDQEWYETYCEGQGGSGSKTLVIGMAYKTEFTAQSGDLSCDWGHENSASKSIEFL